MPSADWWVIPGIFSLMLSQSSLLRLTRLEGAKDWAVSRNRFWGTPMPMWVSEDGEEMVAVGSIAELKELSGVEVRNLASTH